MPVWFRFFIELITFRTLGTLRAELPVGNNNGTTFKHRPTAEKRDDGDTFLHVFLV